MQTSITAYFHGLMRTGIKESKWFRTAPPEFQKTAKIRILGIEERPYTSSMAGLSAGSSLRPALIAECECGGDVERFSLLLNSTATVENIRQ